MNEERESRRRLLSALVSFAALAAVTLTAVVAHLWVLTAIPIGFLFGFFLQKGDLCGASAFSEVLVARDGRKVFGLWIAIVTAMCGFAVLDLAGLVTLNPKPLFYWNYLVGVLLFGAGMVLAGGCVSGCLYKAATGNLNSIVALLTIPIGIALVEYGPLHDWFAGIKKIRAANVDGTSVTLSSVTGLPFWLLAALFAVATVVIVVVRRGRRRPELAGKTLQEDRRRNVLSRSWKPWQAGLAIGVLSALAYLSSAGSGRNYPLGVTHGVLHIELLATDSPVKHVWQVQPKPSVPPTESTGQPTKKVVWWLIALVTFLVVGSHVSARLRGNFKLMPKSPDEIIIAFFGGLLVGAGAALARGCVVGNIMSGVALMSVGNMLFAVVIILTNWATAYVYMRGWKS